MNLKYAWLNMHGYDKFDIKVKHIQAYNWLMPVVLTILWSCFKGFCETGIKIIMKILSGLLNA